jgi:LysM repeat protein
MPHLEQYAKSLMKSQGATDIKSKPSNVDMTEWVKATITAEGGAEALTYFSDTVINKGVELAGVAPPSNTHTVKKGDSLYRIAKSLGTTVEKLQAANNIKNANSIAIGQKIKRG